MKKIFSFAVLIFSALCMLLSCNKEQTSLSLSDIPGKAEITGKLVINYGQTVVGGKLVDKILPAVNVEVIVKLSNSSFVSGASGYAEYKTHTDENGEYSVIIPALDKGVNAIVTVDDILGTFSEPISSTKTEEIRGVFSFYTNVSGVKPGNIKIVNGEFEFEEED